MLKSEKPGSFYKIHFWKNYREVGQIDTQPFTAPQTLVSCFRVKMSEIYIDYMKKTLSTSCSLYTIHLCSIRNLFT